MNESDFSITHKDLKHLTVKKTIRKSKTVSIKIYEDTHAKLAAQNIDVVKSVRNFLEMLVEQTEVRKK